MPSFLPGSFAGGADSGPDSGTLGGFCLLAWPRHQPPMQITSGKGFVLRCFLLDCCLCISAMMSSTGRSEGHDGGIDCASIAALRTITVTARRTDTRQLYRAGGPAFPLFSDSAQGDLQAEVKRVIWHEVAHWLGYETEESKWRPCDYEALRYLITPILQKPLAKESAGEPFGSPACCYHL